MGKTYKEIKQAQEELWLFSYIY